MTALLGSRGTGQAGQPTWWASLAVRSASLPLPAEHRCRYRQEFLAELYGMTPAEQRHHASGVLSRVWPCGSPSASRNGSCPRRPPWPSPGDVGSESTAGSGSATRRGLVPRVPGCGTQRPALAEVAGGGIAGFSPAVGPGFDGTVARSSRWPRSRSRPGCLAGRSALPLDPGDGGRRGMPRDRQGQAVEPTKSASRSGLPSRGSARVPGWWWGACGWGRACQHRPARSLHLGVVGERGSHRESCRTAQRRITGLPPIIAERRRWPSTTERRLRHQAELGRLARGTAKRS